MSVFRFRRPSIPASRPGSGTAGDGHDNATRRDPLHATVVTPRIDPQRMWDALNPLKPDEQAFARRRLIAAHAGDPAGSAFDLLRTQLVQAAAEHGWRRIAVTSPTRGCGKSFVLANLALAL
ncbi:MAG: exopolysaccharide biosynthesis protein, partial [Gemmobacter sp.]